jgi:hypothetical protein
MAAKCCLRLQVAYRAGSKEVHQMLAQRVVMGLTGALAVAGLALTGASAQEWRRGEYEYFKEAHRFGPLCEYRIRARGAAHVALFGGGHQVRKAEARSVQDWEFEAARLFGPRYSSWALAMGKELRCDVRGTEFVCAASGHPCRR